MSNLSSFDKSFKQYLTSKITDNNNTYTHQDLVLKNKYYIDKNELPIFYKLIKNGIEIGYENMNICERNNKDNKSIIVDLDFKYIKNEDNDRRYNLDIINKFIKIYFDKISEYHYIVEGCNIALIYEKEKPYYNIDRNEIKDGVHIVFPYIRTNNLYQEKIREEVINSGLLDNLFSSMNCNNSLEDILDKAVLKNAWLLYGNRKEKNKLPYMYKHCISYDKENKEVSLEQKDFDIEKLIILRSVRHVKINTEFLENDMTPIVKKIDKKLKQNNHISNMYTLNSSNIIKDHKYKLILRLVKMLNIKRVENYEDWIKLGWCLRNINDNELYLKLWIFKSKQSNKYNKESQKACTDVWNVYTDNNNKLTEGSLRRWANEDNPEKYKELVEKDINKLLNSAIEKPNCSTPMAELLYELYKSQYYCTSRKQQTWYKFDKRFHRWLLLNENNDFNKILSKEIYNRIKKYEKYILEKKQNELDELDDAYNKINNVQNEEDEFNTSDDENDENDNIDNKYYNMSEEKYNKTKLVITDKYKPTFNNINTLIEKVLDITPKDKIIRDCSSLFFYEDNITNKSFEEILDTSNQLIVFNNGVYDLDNHIFRAGEPCDYCSVSTSITYKEFTDNHPIVKEVYTFLKQVLPIPNVFNYVMKVLASCLTGENRDENAYFFTGEGGNGKSKLIELVKLTIGEYYCSPSASILQQKRSSAENASPSLISTKSKRITVIQEPEENKLNAGMLKEWTGGDTITGRGLYEKKMITFKPQFTLVIVSNHLPELPADDGGIWRRVKNIKFVSRFCENPDSNKPYEFKIDKRLSNKMNKWPQAFMWILIQHYKKYVEEGLTEPKEVIEEINNYRNEYNSFSQWAEDCIIRTDNNSNKVQCNLAYNSYKDHCNSKSQLDPKKEKDFRKYMNKTFSKQVGNNWQGIKLEDDNYN